MVVRISKKYGRGGLSKSIASKKVPDVIVGGYYTSYEDSTFRVMFKTTKK